MKILPYILCCQVSLLLQAYGDPQVRELPMEPIKSVFKIYSTKPIAGIPDKWVKEKGNDVLRYGNFIKSLKLKNIDPYLVIYPHFKRNGNTVNSLPPRRLWQNISQVLKVIDRLATTLDAKVDPFICVYKSPEYNRSLKGPSRSRYSTNNAVRFTFKGVPPEKVAILAKKLRAEGLFKGGIGNHKDYTYIDTCGKNTEL